MFATAAQAHTLARAVVMALVASVATVPLVAQVSYSRAEQLLIWKRYPDFFKVALSDAGNHDNRSDDIDRSDQYQGLLARDTVRKDEPIKANRTFDLIIAPKRAHGLNEPYFVRQRWDYFVQYLMGATPPDNYEITRAADAAGGPGGATPDDPSSWR